MDILWELCSIKVIWHPVASLDTIKTKQLQHTMDNIACLQEIRLVVIIIDRLRHHLEMLYEENMNQINKIDLSIYSHTK